MSIIASMLKTLGLGGTVVTAVGILITAYHAHSIFRTISTLGGLVKVAGGVIVLATLVSLFVPGIEIAVNLSALLDWVTGLLDVVPVPEGVPL